MNRFSKTVSDHPPTPRASASVQIQHVAMVARRPTAVRSRDQASRGKIATAVRFVRHLRWWRKVSSRFTPWGWQTSARCAFLIGTTQKRHKLGATPTAATLATLSEEKPSSASASDSSEVEEVCPPPPPKAKSGSVSASTSSRPHTSLASMLRMAGLRRLSVAGDGNCAYYAAAATASSTTLQSARLWPLQHARASQRGGFSQVTPRDLKLQREMRRRVVDWLQQPENAEHRHVGFNDAKLKWNARLGKYCEPHLPSARAVSEHRRDGTYANSPALRGLAEILKCRLVSLDSSKLYDRVPVFTAASQHTVQLRSWNDEIVPVLRGEPYSWRRASPLEQRLPLLVIVNNGQSGNAGHFDATTHGPITTH